MEKGIIKTKVTPDFILSLYDKAKKMKSQQKKLELMKQIRVLSEHMGEYIVKPIY